ncbi:hypothetical protein EIP91_005322 [Steccherinum ochraceum]|uniref:F-box domain-containing protein n=1 Tax=Steccherinum ochraceum TaxID=92696 RepID=A0A4R0R7C6_9APHY|nr:hypothetical protein EIP91_005322 [Steccherinum ochraceum]
MHLVSSVVNKLPSIGRLWSTKEHVHSPSREHPQNLPPIAPLAVSLPLPPDNMAPDGLLLPPEIDDYMMSVFATLPDGPQLLRLAALVCRAWLAASRVHLYRDVTIQTEGQFDEFERVVIDSPMINDCVRILRLDRRGRKYELNFPWVNTKLASALPKALKRLETLEMLSIEEKWRAESFRKLSSFTSVTTLSLDRCGFSTEELLGVISAFPSLMNLRIVDFIELFNGRDENVQLMHPPQPLRLVLHCDDIPSHSMGKENLLDYLLKSGCEDTVRSLDIQVSKRNVLHVKQFIQKLGPSLEELRLGFVRRFGHYDEDLDMLNTVDLSSNTNLQHITFVDPAPLAVQSLLASLANPLSGIRTISFAVRVYDVKSVTSAKNVKNPSLASVLTEAIDARIIPRHARIRFLVDWDPAKVKGVQERSNVWEQLELVREEFETAYCYLKEERMLDVVRQSFSD